MKNNTNGKENTYRNNKEKFSSSIGTSNFS